MEKGGFYGKKKENSNNSRWADFNSSNWNRCVFGTRKTETNNTELAYVYRVSLMNPASQVQRMAGTVEPQETWEVQKSSDREVEQILVKAGMK